MRKYVILFFLLVAVNGVALAQDTIKIGVLTDLSGNGAYLGNQTRIGALLAEAELKQQGKNIEVVFEDSALNTTRGISAAQKLLSLDKVDAMYVDFNVIVVAVSALIEQNKKVMVYSSGAESVARKNKFAFKSYLDFSLGCETLAREFLKRGIKKIGVLKVEAEYGELCLAGARKVVDVVEESYRQGDNVASQVLSLKNKGVQAVINACFEIDAINMLKAIAVIKYNAVVGVNEDGIPRKVEEQFQQILAGGLTFGFQRTNDKIVNGAKRLSGGDKVTSFERVGLSYVHVKQMFSAVAACRGKQAECVTDTLGKAQADEDIGFEGWKDRIARIRTIVKEYSSGTLKQIGSYVANE